MYYNNSIICSTCTYLTYIVVIKEKTGPKIDYFAGFCHHPVMIIGVHMHVYSYPLFKSGTKSYP